jgi:hypothetical protein
MKLALATTTLGYIFAQVVAPAMGEIGPWVQLGAVGALGYVAFALVGEMRASRVDSAKQRAEHDASIQAIMERWDGWEDTRHKDAQSMQETLRTMVATCADTRKAMVCLPHGAAEQK